MEIDLSTQIYFHDIYPKFPDNFYDCINDLKVKILAKLDNELTNQYEINWWLSVVLAFVQNEKTIKFFDYEYVYKCRKSQDIYSIEKALVKDFKKLSRKVQKILNKKHSAKFRGIYRCSCVYEKIEVWI